MGPNGEIQQIPIQLSQQQLQVYGIYSIYLTIYLLSIYPSIYLSIYLSIFEYIVCGTCKKMEDLSFCFLFFLRMVETS